MLRTVGLLALAAWAAPHAPAPSAPLDAVSERIRTSSRDLNGHIQRLGDLTAQHAGEDPPAESLRSKLRAAVADEADRLHDLLDEFWQLEDQGRMAKGAAILSQMLAGKARTESARAVMDTQGPMDFDESAKRLVANAARALEREASAYRKAGARRDLARGRRLRDAAWAGVAGAVLTGLAAAFILRRAG
ncbi:MAG: hypothetical protein HYZ75_07750 [Elusimicrobia bacterium]|nr:hypothetical protein [Elusimicrobiota bacterium]